MDIDKTLKKIMKELDIQAPIEEVKIGILVEQEHTLKGPKKGIYSVVPNKLMYLIKIAAAHLSELPDYYSRLKKMESEGKKASVLSEDEEAIFPDDIVQDDSKEVKRSAKILEKPSSLERLREDISHSVRYVADKLIPEAKAKPNKLSALVELRKSLEDSLLSLDATLQALK